MGEFLAWFGTDADCRDYLAWLRWPDGFACDECGHVGGWQLADGRWECVSCAHRTSVTAGTIFDRTRTPLTVWFYACWSFATAKNGTSALSLQRTLQIGSSQTAWAMLHRLRSVLIRPGRELLLGQVEVDETYMGGEEARLAGGRARGKKALVAVAVEVKPPKGFGRCRMRIIPDGSAGTLHAFITDNVAPGSMPMTGVASAPPRPWARTSTSCCPVCTAQRPWPSGGRSQCLPPVFGEQPGGVAAEAPGVQ